MPGDPAPLFEALEKRRPDDPMPVLFVGHGNPMNAIQDTVFSTTWDALGRRLPRPQAILCISAHWLTNGDTRVSVTDNPATIHDFYGFPDPLYEQRYRAPGAPDAARQVMAMVDARAIVADDEWGLDHGAWSVLIRMFPEADIPVFQLSLDYQLPPREHFRLARQLKPLRDNGVLVIGSGNLVHNLGAMQKGAPPYDWAVAFDAWVTAGMDRGDDLAVVDFQKTGDLARNAHPTWDHFLPLIYALGQRDPADRLLYFNEGFDLASISMRSLLLIR